MCGDARKIAIGFCTARRSTAAHLGRFILLSSGCRNCVLPFLRRPSPWCDQAKVGRSARAADLVQTHCSRYAEVWSIAVRHVRQIDRRQDAGTAAAVPVVCRSDARQTALGPAREMSGVKDSGRERGHGDIDANNPSRHFVQQLRPAISIALSALAVLAMTAFIILLDLTTVCLEPA
jgi:hypothetical protein